MPLQYNLRNRAVEIIDLVAFGKYDTRSYDVLMCLSTFATKACYFSLTSEMQCLSRSLGSELLTKQILESRGFSQTHEVMCGK